VATLFLTWAARHRETSVRIVGARGSITWIDGALTLERDGKLEMIDCSRELDKQSYAQWFADLFMQFGDVLDAGATSAAAGAAREDVARVARILEAAYHASESGGRVPIGEVETAGRG
jgi:predicted dehydrogenase